LSPNDISLTVYEKDSSATAVVLYEQGYYRYDAVGNQIKLIKEVHRKIKVLDSKKFDESTVEIPLTFSDEESEIVKGYRAMTHNGNAKSIVDKDAVFVSSDPEIGKIFKIAFPNVKDGSVLEYIYSVESSLLFNFYGCEFQGKLPKIYSEFLFKIPGTFKFNNVLYGKQPLYLNKSDWVSDCIQTTYFAGTIRCPITLYAMVDVPSFREEDYMLS